MSNVIRRTKPVLKRALRKARNSEIGRHIGIEGNKVALVTCDSIDEEELCEGLSGGNKEV